MPTRIRTSASTRAIFWLAVFCLQAFGISTLSFAAPTITTPPQNVSVYVGQDATFTIVATSDAALTYQWQTLDKESGNWVNITEAGATTNKLVYPAVTAEMNGWQFRCVVSDGAEVNSNEVTLTVKAAIAPVLVWVSGSTVGDVNTLTVNEGRPATFTVKIEAGTDPFTYEWKRGDEVIPDATGATYTTDATTYADNDAVFTVTVGNAAGSVSLESTLAVEPAVLPVIAWADGSDSPTVNEGRAATFTVKIIDGTTDLITYAWVKNGVPIPGATGVSYTTPATTIADNGSVYAVTVTNPAGSAVLYSALTVIPAVAPVIAWASGTDTQTVKQGLRSTFTVDLVGGSYDPITYTWRKNGIAVLVDPADGRTSSYTTPPASNSDHEAVFTVEAANPAGTFVISGTLFVIPAVAPVLEWAPGNEHQTVGEGDEVTFTANLIAGTTEPLTYIWRRSSTIVATGTSGVITSHTVAVTTYADNGARFVVSASNPAGVATLTGTLTVMPGPTTRARIFKQQVGATGVATVTLSGAIDLALVDGATVASGKTILGADNAATLSGDLDIPPGAGNIVILGIKHTQGALLIDGANGVDVSHCTFTDAPVTVTGGADNIAFSWNRFAATGTEAAAMFIDNAGAATGILLHHNIWEDGLLDAMPAATNARVFMYNNLVCATGNNTATVSGSGAQILSARNVYEGTNNPLLTQSGGLLRAIDNSLLATTGSTVTGTGTVFTPAWSHLMHASGTGVPGADELILLLDANAGNTAGRDSITPPMIDAGADASISAIVDGFGAFTTGTSAELPLNGGSFKLTATTTGFAPGASAAQRWYRNNFPIQNATGGTYTVSAATKAADEGVYTHVQTTPSGEILTTGAFKVSVGAATLPLITEHPVAQLVDVGGNVRFTVAAAGVDLSYQWRRNSVDIAGATGESFSITNVQRADIGTYTVAVKNAAGTVVSHPATLTVNAGGDFVGGASGGALSLWWIGGLALLGVLRGLRRLRRGE